MTLSRPTQLILRIIASVYIFGRIESDNTTAAAAVSVFLLVISITILFGINLISRWRSRHDDV